MVYKPVFLIGGTPPFFRNPSLRRLQWARSSLITACGNAKQWPLSLQLLSDPRLGCEKSCTVDGTVIKSG